MLTRSGVAKRLGKSIATIRRMEGVELHPSRDERGIHRFSRDEVEAVARGAVSNDRSHRIAQLKEHKRGRAAYLDENDDCWPEERQHDLAALLRRRAEDLEARRKAEQDERERADLVRREVSKQLADEMAVLDATRALDEIVIALERHGTTLDEETLSEFEHLIEGIEAELA